MERSGGIENLAPGYDTFTAPLTIDFTVTLSDAPFSPSAALVPPTFDVPEPWTWAMLLAGLAGLGAIRRSRGDGMGLRHPQ